ncbi:MAG: histidine phosphotransferase family protein [Actinomycetota bacterium]
MPASDDLRLAELLCARLCHDMAGPVGAAAAGAELIEDGIADPETMSLVAASAGGASARLKFFRAALGPAAEAPQALTGLRDLVDGYLATAASAPRIALDWRCEPATLAGEAARLLLNLVLIARDALPRGGAVAVSVTGRPGRLAVVARGEPAALGDEVRAVLAEGRAPAGPRGAQAWLARRIADLWCPGGLQVLPVAGGVELAAVVENVRSDES